MRTFRFMDFEVYQDAKKFRQFVRQLLSKFPSGEKYVLGDQINRSCLSVILNIAEGSAKKSDKDFARFLEMAIASVSETVAGFDVAKDDRVISEGEFHQVEHSAESITKQLGGFLKTLRS